MRRSNLVVGAGLLVPWNRSPLRKFASNRRRCQGAATQAGPCPPPRRRNAGSGVEGRKLV